MGRHGTFRVEEGGDGRFGEFPFEEMHVRVGIAEEDENVAVAKAFFAHEEGDAADGLVDFRLARGGLGHKDALLGQHARRGRVDAGRGERAEELLGELADARTGETMRLGQCLGAVGAGFGRERFPEAVRAVEKRIVSGFARRIHGERHRDVSGGADESGDGGNFLRNHAVEAVDPNFRAAYHGRARDVGREFVVEIAAIIEMRGEIGAVLAAKKREVGELAAERRVFGGNLRGGQRFVRDAERIELVEESGERLGKMRLARGLAQHAEFFFVLPQETAQNDLLHERRERIILLFPQFLTESIAEAREAAHVDAREAARRKCLREFRFRAIRRLVGDEQNGVRVRILRNVAANVLATARRLSGAGASEEKMKRHGERTPFRRMYFIHYTIERE